MSNDQKPRYTAGTWPHSIADNGRNMDQDEVIALLNGAPVAAEKTRQLAAGRKYKIKHKTRGDLIIDVIQVGKQFARVEVIEGKNYQAGRELSLRIALFQFEELT